MPQRILMTPNQAANYLQLSMSTLAKMRINGNGPPFTKVGRKTVRYRISELDAWLDERERMSTAQNSQFEH